MFDRGFNQASLMYLAGDEILKIIKDESTDWIYEILFQILDFHMRAHLSCLNSTENLSYLTQLPLF